MREREKQNSNTREKSENGRKKYQQSLMGGGHYRDGFAIGRRSSMAGVIIGDGPSESPKERKQRWQVGVNGRKGVVLLGGGAVSLMPQLCI